MSTTCDESMATKKREPIVVPVGPVTRARAKQFKERLNGLIHKIQQEGSGLHMEGDQKLINIIQVTPTHIDQLVQDGIQVRSNWRTRGSRREEELAARTRISRED